MIFKIKELIYVVLEREELLLPCFADFFLTIGLIVDYLSSTSRVQYSLPCWSWDFRLQ